MEPLKNIEIRNWLVRYLAQEISLKEFEDWFVPATWDVEKSKNPFAVQTAQEIDLRLAEFSNGHITEDELKTLLRPLVQQYEVPLCWHMDKITLPSYEYGASSTVVWGRTEEWQQPFGKGLVMIFELLGSR